ncbi:N-succinylarginine dihydrolase [Fluoribacter dumoffii]|uniref:N-succinylarginine dihydrolase n=1 Tax=Fluoribacter dumoffii TaxID=463 RepID=A0A377G9L0_9GAMM|nr:N-succinylarginine dihydrolase [Fluoribacter dumoffii]KTC93496.1 succinylarginine dihydrolase [Fluoribacter dumoffii NY 23]MCW8385694.1 N-succinylarginine dihydrolase [Fluoribacter dumoffii]MCW8418724.1 N-succinylarginine dihydrolase [Fluoribacter dumoffii]MCW8453432.1 N-succinylarginine dihydrolase [Fluoribacter dumoffii]MCW8459348.1 N-succinylarginine dihydrolase [Fluoribacter dumoffii]
MKVYELNMDGLVGPTHNYAGLAPGNIASLNYASVASNPQAAALQGLKKMRLLHSMGLKQGLFPPHQRPNLELLHQLGFQGKPTEQLYQAYNKAPELLSACYSASSMWAANAATVTPSIDTLDRKVHFTAANLISNLHRHQEADFSKKLLECIFLNPDYFKHHPILPRSTITGDEGAANHNRICQKYNQPGIHLFVYGKKALAKNPLNSIPVKYPARQTREASEAIVRQHQLPYNKVVFACQNPLAIDQGVFHNDVISVANESVFLVHEQAFHQQNTVLKELSEKSSFPLTIIQLSQKELSVADAVESYLFNSQIISLPQSDSMMLIAPFECQNNSRVNECIERILSDASNPINSVHFLDLKQSMQNGGGPACLRLRVPLNEKELDAMHQGVLINEELLKTLEKWILKHYRTHLTANDLADPLFLEECFCALDELTQILKLGSIYPFQLEKTC